MSSLSLASTTSALEASKSKSGKFPCCIHPKFDKNIINGKALQWILYRNSNIISAPAGKKYSNGLEECTWRTLIQMAQVYITGKKVGDEFWYLQFVTR